MGRSWMRGEAEDSEDKDDCEAAVEVVDIMVRCGD